MKTNIIILTSILSLSSVGCYVSRETANHDDQVRMNESILRSAIENRKFIIKLDRLYTYGGFLDLRPRSNYIIVDGQKAVINAAYFGRQHGFRPVAGINMRGMASDYRITNKYNKGLYDVKLRVDNGRNTFDVTLRISKDGSASAYVNSLHIPNAQYSGYVVPIGEQVDIPQDGKEMI